MNDIDDIRNHYNELTERWIDRLVVKNGKVADPDADPKLVAQLNQFMQESAASGILLALMELERVGLLSMRDFTKWLEESEA